MTPKDFFDWSQKYPELGVQAYDEKRVYFILQDAQSLEGFLVLTHKIGCEPQVAIVEKNVNYCVPAEHLSSFNKEYERSMLDMRKGIPDLQWATCKQIGSELKKRENLTFVLLWMEDDYFDNLHIEASGEANSIIGLTTRGLNILLNTTEKRTKIQDSSDEE
jgi:hypothetical protein